MARVVTDSEEFRGARFIRSDLSGAVFREVELSGARFVGAVLVDVDIDGYIRNLVVNGVEVMPLVEAELDRLHPERVLMRSDDPDDLREAWSHIESMWAGTLDRIAALPDERRHQRVADEWSAVETVRHLIFVTDGWFSRTILGDRQPYAPFALPASFMAGGAEMGIDADANPTYDEVVAARREREAMIRDYLATVTADELARRCEPNPSPGVPAVVDHTVLQCLHVLLNEEWAHHQFAIRDLTTIERGAPE